MSGVPAKPITINDLHNEGQTITLAYPSVYMLWGVIARDVTWMGRLPGNLVREVRAKLDEFESDGRKVVALMIGHGMVDALSGKHFYQFQREPEHVFGPALETGYCGEVFKIQTYSDYIMHPNRVLNRDDMLILLDTGRTMRFSMDI